MSAANPAGSSGIARMPIWSWLLMLVIAIPAAALLLIIWRGTRRLAAAISSFQPQRRRLETLFFDTASSLGKPRGLRWKACDWGDAVEFARDRKTGQLFAFAGVTISFEAIEGGDMEGVAAVGNLRNASAVFVFNGASWGTVGRAVFNLNPDEAVQHFGEHYERVAATGSKSTK
jgi:hypothetical protein